MIRALLLAALLLLVACIGEPFTTALELGPDAGDARGAQLAGEDAADPLAAGDAGDGPDAPGTSSPGDDDGAISSPGDDRPVGTPGHDSGAVDAGGVLQEDAGGLLEDAGGTPHACSGGPGSCPAMCRSPSTPCCTSANLCGCALLGSVCR